MERCRTWLRREGWLLLLAAACAGLCLWLGCMSPSADENAQLNRLLSQVEGAGRTDAAVHLDDTGAVTGVVIVSEGGADVAVQLRLIRAVTTLLNVPASRVAVFAREGG